jgi:hypothetical protein
MTDRGTPPPKKKKKKTQRKPLSNAASSTMNLTWSQLGLNPWLRGEKPTPYRLSYGTALLFYNVENCVQTPDVRTVAKTGAISTYNLVLLIILKPLDQSVEWVGYGLGNSGTELKIPVEVETVFFSTASKPALTLNRPPIQ